MNFDPKDVANKIREAGRKAAREELIKRLCYIGEECVNTARSLPSPSAADFPNPKNIPPHQPNYIDWSANLKSSIGYVVVVDGEIVRTSSFEPVKNGEEGAKQGLQFAIESAEQYKEGITLILVAGMHYAAYVQSKGYDVLNSAVIKAEEMIPKLLGELGFSVK